MAICLKNYLKEFNDLGVTPRGLKQSSSLAPLLPQREAPRLFPQHTHIECVDTCRLYPDGSIHGIAEALVPHVFQGRPALFKLSRRGQQHID